MFHTKIKFIRKKDRKTLRFSEKCKITLRKNSQKKTSYFFLSTETHIGRTFFTAIKINRSGKFQNLATLLA